MNILAFFAHPDDETMLSGGSLAFLAQQGAQVHYLCATRGEGGELGEPPVCTIEELGETREREMVCAVQNLGGKSLTFLGYTDPRVGPEDELYAFTDNLTVLASQVIASFRQFNIDVILTHGSNGEYGHPAHVICHQAALAAVMSIQDDPPMLYTIAASFPTHPRPRLTNEDDPAHLIMDVRPWIDRKTEAALCHRSQHALFVRRASKEAGRKLNVPDVIISVEGLHRAFPTVNGPLKDPVAKMFTKAGILKNP
jgi:LmbE family N-acetylglucosaminyl deacetylase